MTEATSAVRPEVAAPPHVESIEDRDGSGRTRRYLVAFWALNVRDVRVLQRSLLNFATRTVMQPLMFVFVFTWVFPKVGQGIGGIDDANFATVLVPGLVATAIIFQGVSAVALPLVTELNITREVEDRVLSPVPTSLVAIQKICFGAAESLVSAIIVFPLVIWLPVDDVDLHISWPAVGLVLVLACLCSGAFGLAAGTAFRPEQVPLLFTTVVLPLTFLGCVHYSWAALEPVPWLQYLSLANPLVYISEGLRAGLTPQLDHMSLWASATTLAAFTVVLGCIGIRGFRRRVLG